jgi:rubrerythrin
MSRRRAGAPPRAAARGAPPASVAALLAQARAIEEEAQARYADLADQMETHNNPEVAALFRRMAEIEGMHVAKIDARAERGSPRRSKATAQARGKSEGPEISDMAAVHYLMTPHHALRVALENETRALRFFARLARRAPNARLKALAATLAEEERQHVRLVEQWLAKYPPPAPDWAEDADPPSERD